MVEIEARISYGIASELDHDQDYEMIDQQLPVSRLRRIQ
jgi:hypothetical protein